MPGTPAQKQRDEDERFIVMRDEQVVALWGVLGDVTDLLPCKSLLEDGDTIDFDGVTFVSWHGARRFFTWMVETGFHLTLTNMPAQLFSCYRVLGIKSDKIKVESSEVRGFTSDGKPESFPVEVDELRKAIKDNREGLDAGDGLYLLDPPTFLLPERFLDKSTFRYEKGFGGERPDEASFWSRYTRFVSEVVTFSISQIEAIKFNLLEDLKKVRDVASYSEKALAIIHPLKVYALATETFLVREEVRAKCDEALEGLRKIQHEMDQAMVALTEDAKGGRSFENYLDTLHSFLVKVGGLKSLCLLCEEYGPTVGELIPKVDVFKVVVEELDGVSEPSEEVLNKIRIAFLIMDVLSEDCWDDTKDLVYEEIFSAKQHINNCIVTIQGFDVVQEAIRHRISEAHYLLDAMDSYQKGEMKFSQLRQNLTDMISRSEVTNQEIDVFNFFMPEDCERSELEERSRAGDVIFF